MKHINHSLLALIALALFADGYGSLRGADSPAAAMPSMSAPTPAAAAPTVIKIKPYPLDTCIVTGEKLGSMGKPVVMIHDGQEIKFCCNSCPKDFAKEPAKYLSKIAEAEKKAAANAPAAVKESPPKPYTLTTCIVSGDELGGKPIVVVYEQQEIKFCCSDCLDEFYKNPTAVMSKLEAKTPPASSN